MIRRTPPSLACLAPLLLALLAPAAAGCGGDDDRPFQVGSGEDEFEDVDEGEVDIETGGQGGYHIWISIRCSECAPTGVVRFGVTDVETGALVTAEGLTQAVDMVTEDEWRQAAGMRAFLAYDGSELDGREVRLWAELDDDAGRTWKDEVVATADD